MCTYSYVVSTGKLSNEREDSILSKVEGSHLKNIHIDKLTVYTSTDLLEPSLHVSDRVYETRQNAYFRFPKLLKKRFSTFLGEDRVCVALIVFVSSSRF